jgi:regulator of PEP synthase PpsR (kinase-PPPase family)
VEAERQVYFVSDHTGITAETLGHSLLTQFDGLRFRQETIPFIGTVERAHEAVAKIDAAAAASGQLPIVFSTLVNIETRKVVMGARCLFLDFFDAFLAPLERELGIPSAHAKGRAHGVADYAKYMLRIEAMNFALANDDGATLKNYDRADVVLVGVSRAGKTPTCLYLALQYGVYAANFPITDEQLGGKGLPADLLRHKAKLFGLTIDADRLARIRNERRPDSKYASEKQVRFELNEAKTLMQRHGIPFLDSSKLSIEELATTILHERGLTRRFF